MALDTIDSYGSVDVASRESPSQQYFGKIANPGDYDRVFTRSSFRNSRMLPLAMRYVESGKFEQGFAVVMEVLRRRDIRLEYADSYPRGTRRDGNGVVMILPSDFSTHNPAQKIQEILHRNMSLTLQRTGSGQRGDIASLIELCEMDIAYAQTLRLGLNKRVHLFRRPKVERQRLMRIADNIEAEARYKMGQIR